MLLSSHSISPLFSPNAFPVLTLLHQLYSSLYKSSWWDFFSSGREVLGLGSAFSEVQQLFTSRLFSWKSLSRYGVGKGNPLVSMLERREGTAEKKCLFWLSTRLASLNKIFLVGASLTVSKVKKKKMEVLVLPTSFFQLVLGVLVATWKFAIINQY